MIISRHRLAYAAALCAGLTLGGCGDSGEKLGQATSYDKDTRKYSGKPDTRPFENAPSAYSNGSTWTANDKASWEAALKQRQQNQSDYTRAN